jgi:hypothetical protein
VDGYQGTPKSNGAQEERYQERKQSLPTLKLKPEASRSHCTLTPSSMVMIAVEVLETRHVFRQCPSTSTCSSSRSRNLNVWDCKRQRTSRCRAHP